MILSCKDIYVIFWSASGCLVISRFLLLAVDADSTCPPRMCVALNIARGNTSTSFIYTNKQLMTSYCNSRNLRCLKGLNWLLHIDIVWSFSSLHFIHFVIPDGKLQLQSHYVHLPCYIIAMLPGSCHEATLPHAVKMNTKTFSVGGIQELSFTYIKHLLECWYCTCSCSYIFSLRAFMSNFIFMSKASSTWD